MTDFVVHSTPNTGARAATVPRPAKQSKHVLLDPQLDAERSVGTRGLPAGMSEVEVADRIVAELLKGTGPILLCVPGTLGATWQSSMLATARALIRTATGSVSVASIPYPNGVGDIITRFLNVGAKADHNVLALVLKKLRAAAPHRPIMLAGESQGAWLIADTLRTDPSLAAAVTRVVVFAKPGFVEMPMSIGHARLGASMVPGTASGVEGVLEFRHTDDIVPSLFHRLRPHLATPWIESLLSGRGLEYRPHHYDWHARDAAQFLLNGTTPAAPEAHESSVHPMRPERI